MLRLSLDGKRASPVQHDYLMNLTLQASDNFKVEKLDRENIKSSFRIMHMNSEPRTKDRRDEDSVTNNIADNMDCLISLGGEVLS